MKKLLITGTSGYLGSALVNYFNEKYSLTKVVHKNSREGEIAVELTDESEVAELARKYSPDYILHAAGKKAQVCEKNQESALVNVLASEFLTRYFPYTVIYFFSSDFVFDGRKGNYVETDSPNPLTVYGKSKLQAEQAYDLDKHCVIRTAGLFDIEQPGFLRYILSNLSKSQKVEAFSDIYSTPTYISYFCEYLEAIVEKELTGLLHVAGHERISRFEFAKLIARTFNYNEDLVQETKAPGSFLSPHDSSLDSSKIMRLLGLEWEPLSHALRDMYNKKSKSWDRKI